MIKLKKLCIGLSLCMCVAGLSACGSNSESEHDHEHGTEQVVSQRPEYPDIKALDYITLPKNYEHMEITVEPNVTDITTEMIDERILQQVSPKSLDSGEVQTGDTVVIDLEGTIDGETFDGGNAENYNLTIGSGTFIEGFEDQLVGMELNKDHPKEKTIRVVFPEDYSNDDLAGKVATFKVKLKDIKRTPQVKELSKEEIKQLSNDEADSIKAYRKIVKQELRDEYDKQYKSNLDAAMLEWLKENVKAKPFPDELKNWYYDSVYLVYSDYAETYGMDVKDVFVSNGISNVTDKESFIKYVSDKVEEELLSEMIPQAIAEDLDVTCTDDEYKEYVQSMMDARYYSGTMEEFEKIFGKTCLRHWAVTDNVYDKLATGVVVTDATHTEYDGELTGNPEVALDEDGNIIPDSELDKLAEQNEFADTDTASESENEAQDEASDDSEEIESETADESAEGE